MYLEQSPICRIAVVMTIVGKIFTVLIFILSVMFLAFSVVVFNTHEELEDQVVALNARNQTLQADINTQTQERDDAMEKLAQEPSARAYAIAALVSAKIAEFPNFGNINSDTILRLAIDFPNSPWTMFPNHFPYCTGRG